MNSEMSSLHKDFFASHLRTQIETLQHILISLENTNTFEYDYVVEALRRVEVDVRRVRNFLAEGKGRYGFSEDHFA